jgi:asparagine synthase (glutamine-hydrolysing)
VSGFAGIVRINPSGVSADADKAALRRMAEAIAFRAPDALQQIVQPRAALAFSLLTTGPAPQSASQPCTVDGEAWLLGDVRCDGRDQLAARLKEAGLRLPEIVTSEELILHTFAQFGESALTEINGDLSFVIWNAKKNRLIAFRDLTGARPFFYSHCDGAIIFSNTLQAIVVSGLVSRELDERFLGDFLLGHPDYDPSISVYRDIRRLPPGHLLEFDERGLAIRRIANMPLEDPLLLKEEEYIEEFRRLLREAVRDRLPPCDTTVLLSGGLDSTTIAAEAASLRKSGARDGNLRLRAFSVDSQPLFNDHETELAARFAAKLGIACDVVHCGDELPFGNAEDANARLPEPVLDPYFELIRSLYRQTAKNSRVAFSGGGGDEVLRLQAWPYLRFLYKKKGKLSAFGTLARYVFGHRKLPPLGAGIRTGARRLLRVGDDQDLPEFPLWLNPEFARRMDLPGRWQLMNSANKSRHEFNPRAYELANDLSVASALEVVDATWTGCPLEFRWPFMDRRLVRFMLRTPPVPWAMDKYLLRRSQVGILPVEILDRPKTPLQGDSLLLHARAGDWNPVPSERPPDCIQQHVNWALLVEQLKKTQDESLHQHLRPVALARWLKNVENLRSIE